ncbi:MAG TPA: hypothetical protein VF329_00120 [Gammaproteobacteria bacterium]
MHLHSRRRFAAGLVTAGFTAPWLAKRCLAQDELPIADAPPEQTDAALERIFVDNSEPPEGEYVVKGLYDWPLWWEETPLEMAVWPADAETIDYAHLPSPNSDASFALNDAALRRIVASHGYSRLAAAPPLVLFGVRGARRAAEPTSPPDFENEVEIVEVPPDHFDYKCLLGVWNTESRKVWVTAASTAPHVAYLYAQREASTFSNEANMMPTGLYRYRVGTHRNGTPSLQPGAFRTAERAFAVLRCVQYGPLTMSRGQYWDTAPTNHGNNIHAGTYGTRADRPRFWSAGCQVLPGYYSDENGVPSEENAFPQGDWARFRIAAGLARAPRITRHEELAPGRFNVETSEDGRRYEYLLTTGRDVRLAGEGRDARTLRFGSSGPKVKALQAALGLPPGQRDGIFGPGVQKLVLAKGDTHTPIVDARLASVLGFDL